MINNSLIYFSCICSGILLAIFTLFPGLDIDFSAIFYEPQIGFIYRNNWLVLLFFLLIPLLTKIFITIMAISLLFNFSKTKNLTKLYKSWVFYLILAGCIGPGLLVNTVFKDHYGRARPSQIVEFGGTKTFSDPMTPSNQCEKNCAFPSGHAAMGYYFTALAYVLALSTHKNLFNKIYITGIIFGSIVGFSRILMGGHFLSDVVASCLIILIVNHLIYLFWKRLCAI